MLEKKQPKYGHGHPAHKRVCGIDGPQQKDANWHAMSAGRQVEARIAFRFLAKSGGKWPRPLCWGQDQTGSLLRPAGGKRYGEATNYANANKTTTRQQKRQQHIRMGASPNPLLLPKRAFPPLTSSSSSSFVGFWPKWCAPLFLWPLLKIGQIWLGF